MKKVGVLLCGCGNMDGTEIHEATLTLLAIDRAGAEAVCMSPSGDQRHVCNYITGEKTDETRSMLLESARIARRNVKLIKDVNPSELDALVIPGGGGAALNISTFPAEGSDCKVNSEVEGLISEFYNNKKPIGGICIAPAVVGKVFQNLGVNLKIADGGSGDLFSPLGNMGHNLVHCPAVECIIDIENRFVSTPAYISAKSIGEVWQGIEKLVNAVVEMA